MPNRIANDPSPTALYSITEVAEYCGRTPQLLRLYYSQDLLPDPVNTTGTATRKQRQFTLTEARSLRNFFASVKHGSLTATKRRAARRKS
jgi:hypothetical protein